MPSPLRSTALVVCSVLLLGAVSACGAGQAKADREACDAIAALDVSSNLGTWNRAEADAWTEAFRKGVSAESPELVAVSQRFADSVQYTKSQALSYHDEAMKACKR